MDEAEADAWLGLVTMLQLLPVSLDAQLQNDSDLTHFEYGLLSRLRFSSDQTLQLKELAAQTSATLARLSHVVSRLEARGFLERSAHPTDKRATNVALTTAGRRAVVLATAGHLRHARKTVLDHLTRDDLAALAEITGKINQGLDPQRLARRSND